MAEYAVADQILEWEPLQSVVLAECVSWSLVASASGLNSVVQLWCMQQQRFLQGSSSLFCSS